MTYLQPNMSSFLGIYIVIGGGCFLSAAIMMPLTIFFISRRFDPLFENKMIALCNPPIGYSRALRSFWYSAIMLMPRWYRNLPRIYAMFNGYDLWEHASKFERFLACYHNIAGSIGMSAAIIFSINHFIFYICGASH